MNSEHMKNSMRNVPKRQERRTVPLVLASGLFAAGLLLFGGQGATAQETSTTIATETTLIATDTTLAIADSTLAVTSDSTLVAPADTADDSTPAGGLDTGFGGTASASDSNRSGLFLGIAGFTLLIALAVRRITKRSSLRANRQPSE